MVKVQIRFLTESPSFCDFKLDLTFCIYLNKKLKVQKTTKKKRKKVFSSSSSVSQNELIAINELNQVRLVFERIKSIVSDGSTHFDRH